MAWPRHGLSLSATQGDEVQKQVAEVAKALYQRTDELAVLLAPAITRHSWSSPLIFGCRRRGAAADRVHAEQHRRVFRVDRLNPTITARQRHSSKR
jgi:hypothetical protein